MNDAVNSHKWSTQGPCTHYWGKEETDTGCTKLLQQEQKDQDNCRECFHRCCKSMSNDRYQSYVNQENKLHDEVNKISSTLKQDFPNNLILLLAKQLNYIEHVQNCVIQII